MRNHLGLPIGRGYIPAGESETDVHDLPGGEYLGHACARARLLAMLCEILDLDDGEPDWPEPPEPDGAFILPPE